MYFLTRFNEKYPGKEIYDSPCFINGNPMSGDIVELERDGILYNVEEDMFYYMFIQGMGQVQLISQNQPGLFRTIEDALKIVYAEYKKLEGKVELSFIKDGRKYKKNIGFAKSWLFDSTKDEIKNE